MDLPPDIPIDPDAPPGALPDLPPGYVWGLKITAEAEVIKAADAEQEG
ncbi:hypothetical protein SAMN05421837_107365 [Amycolatopsis pretoriensis]|uniref:Uncharacterized protein n=1 Tax=Amycolatopsis pretoriensis TaxID=218821 RepID=A0A1H5R8J6_9PSEU|nr:hypothetical protein [Amycolatopsis pretoriensis]SEF34394.1 hypothetical protein SAMN05421837_107365 [Amycolatopsis pretoriensis]